MKTLVKLLIVAGLCLSSFVGGYMLSNKGYQVVDSSGSSLIKTNAAQITKDENAKLGRDVVGKTEEAAEQLLKENGRTFFVGLRDGKTVENKSPKTFTNLTVEVKEGKVVKVIGWY